MKTKPNAFTRGLEEVQMQLRSLGEDIHVLKPMTKWQRDPIGWIEKYLGVDRRTMVWSEYEGYEDHIWDGDANPIEKMCMAIANWDKGKRDVGVEAATGTNKTFMAACLTLWFLACFEDAEVITIAPKEKQLKLHIWKEIGKLWPKFELVYPTAQKLGLQVRMIPGADHWTAVGFAAGVGAEEEAATRAQGFHSKHQLFITEETPGVHSAVMTAIENTRTAPHNLHLALGNPDHTQDELHKFCEKETTEHIRISALDHPNLVLNDPTIIEGACSWQSVNARKTNYGEESRLYISRCRGICPKDATDSLIRWVWCSSARDRDEKDVEAGFGAMGVDVGNSPNGDKGAIAYGMGAHLLTIDSWPCPNANLFASEKVVPQMKSYNLDEKMVGVDNVGVGAGTVNELLRLGYMIRSLGGAEAEVYTEEEEHFANLRSQMWWQMRLDLQHGRIKLPDDIELFQDLTIPTWEAPNGKITVESKKALKKRLRRSPDKGDAAVYWNWIRTGRAEATIGGAMVDI